VNFEEYKNLYFNGDEDKALDKIVEETEKDEVNKEGIKYYGILFSLNDEQAEKYRIKLKKYRNEHKRILDRSALLESMNGYIKKRNVLAIFFGVPTVLGLFYIPFFLIMCVVYVPLLIWIWRENKVLKAIKRGDFYLVKACCSYKNVEISSVDASDVDTHKVYFPGCDGYTVSQMEYSSIQYGDEYFLLITNNPKRIEKLFCADRNELSEDFCLSGDRYYLKK